MNEKQLLMTWRLSYKHTDMWLLLRVDLVLPVFLYRYLYQLRSNKGFILWPWLYLGVTSIEMLYFLQLLTLCRYCRVIRPFQVFWRALSLATVFCLTYKMTNLPYFWTFYKKIIDWQVCLTVSIFRIVWYDLVKYTGRNQQM